MALTAPGIGAFMKSPTSYLGRKAAKATIRHSAKGTAAKARRQPVRAVTLVAAGAAAGGVGGWFAGRAASPAEQDSAS